jgi:large subunit ribosomal protein L21
MQMYAIFEAKGKQFRATPDLKLRIPSLHAEPGDRVTFDTVLLAQQSADADILVGRPALEGASVAVEVLRHGKGEKIIVYKMKRRKGYRKKQGHRQKFTEVRVVDIEFGSDKTAKPKAAAKPKSAPKAPKAEKAPKAPKAEKASKKTAASEDAGLDATDAAIELAAEAGIDIEAVEGTGDHGRVLKGDVEEAVEAAEAAAIDATPTAKELAEEAGIDLATVEGTGKDGRILKSDVQAVIKEQEGK